VLGSNLKAERRTALKGEKKEQDSLPKNEAAFEKPNEKGKGGGRQAPPWTRKKE